MVKPKPTASSTPKFVNISGRRRIGDTNDDTYQSPIYNYIPKPEDDGDDNVESNSSGESDHYVESNDETDNSVKEEFNTAFCNCIPVVGLVVIGIIIALGAALYAYGDTQHKVIATPSKILSQEFPSQVEDFWIHIQEGVEDVKRFKQPKTFLLLYTNDSQETLKNILMRITEFAVCTLTNCTASPVVLRPSDLSTASVLEDYGEIIFKNKVQLEENGVMIINNLESIPSVSAQAFHSFCDEYNPIVKNAVFIFTMKIDDFKNSNIKYVEKILRNNWKDLNDDIFYALFTRIANVVLPVMVEEPIVNVHDFWHTN